MSDKKKSIVFVDVNVDLFKRCFFQEAKEPALKRKAPRASEESWNSFELIIINTKSDTASDDLVRVLQNPGVRSVVIQNTEMGSSILSILKRFYDSGGLVVHFGISTKQNDPSTLSQQFGFPGAWKFSAYTNHSYEITSEGWDCLGYDVEEQERTKSFLLDVPIQDRWIVPKAQPLHKYISDWAGSLDGDEPDEEWKTEAERAKAGYVKYCEEVYRQCPLAVHRNKNGGRLAYIGFANSDGNIPRIVRLLVTNKNLPNTNKCRSQNGF